MNYLHAVSLSGAITSTWLCEDGKKEKRDFLRKHSLFCGFLFFSLMLSSLLQWGYCATYSLW